MLNTTEWSLWKETRPAFGILPSGPLVLKAMLGPHQLISKNKITLQVLLRLFQWPNSQHHSMGSNRGPLILQRGPTQTRFSEPHQTHLAVDEITYLLKSKTNPRRGSSICLELWVFERWWPKDHWEFEAGLGHKARLYIKTKTKPTENIPANGKMKNVLWSQKLF